VNKLTKSGIYVVKNKLNGKCYYGSAINVEKRFLTHKYYLRKGNSPCKKLQRAWIKYRENNFDFIQILTCNQSDLLFFEQLIIDRECAVKNGYNICPTAGSSLGLKRTREAIEKTANAHRGVKLTEEHKNKISEAKKGVKQTQLAILNRTQTLKGMKRTQDFCEKARARRQLKTPTAKLKHDDIIRIRELKEQKLTYKQIGEIFGVSPAAICDIVKLRTWGYVTDDYR